MELPLRYLRLLFMLLLSTAAAAQTVTYTCATGSMGTEWTNTTASGYSPIIQNANACVPSGGLGTIGLVVYTGSTFANDQYSQGTYHGTYGSNSSTGPCVHMNVAGNGYCWIVGPGLVYRLTGGAGDGGIGNCQSITVSSGDVLRLSVQNNSFTCQDVTTGQSSGAGSDATYPTGAPAAEADQRFSTDNNFTTFQAGTYTSLAVAPNIVAPGSTGNVITLTGVNTAWTTGTVFTLTNNGSTAAAITAQNVTSGTSATVTVSAGSTSGSFYITDPSTSNNATVFVQNPYTAVETDCTAGCSGTVSVNFSSATTAGDALLLAYAGDSAVSSITTSVGGTTYSFNIACTSTGNGTEGPGDGVVFNVINFLLYAMPTTSIQVTFPSGVTFHGRLYGFDTPRNAIDVGVGCAAGSRTLGSYSSVTESTKVTASPATNYLLIGVLNGFPSTPTITGDLTTTVFSHPDSVVSSGIVSSTGTYSYGGNWSPAASSRPSVAMVALLNNTTLVPTLPAPIFSYVGATYGTTIPLRIHDPVPGGNMYISTTGTATCSSTPYVDNSVINVSTSQTISAIDCNRPGFQNSPAASQQFAINSTTTAKTVYIRPDGGTRYSGSMTSGQCNGLVDAPYPGSGTNQPCAFNQFQFICDDQTSGGWQNNCVIQGGDKVMVEGCADPLYPDHNCAIGYTSGSTSGPWYVGGTYGNIGAYNAPIPSGLPIGTITHCVITANVATLTVPNSLSAGDVVMPDELSPCAQLNAQPLTVLATGLSTTQFEANVSLPDQPDVASTADTGTLYRPTRILGQNFGACETANHVVDPSKTVQLFGNFNVNSTFNLGSAHHVDIECMEWTSVATCISHGYPAVPAGCNKDTSPIDNFDSNGAQTGSDSSGIFLKDIYIHHHTNRGVIGPIGGVVTCWGCDLFANGMAGWDFDDGSSSTPNEFGLQNMNVNGSSLFGNGTLSVNATWNMVHSKIRASGCNQMGVGATSVHTCYSQSTGGYGDGVGTPPGQSFAVFCDYCEMDYNVQDGVDIGHADAGPSGAGYMDGGFVPETFLNSSGFGNQGAAYKAGPQNNPVIWRNNVIIGNCQWLSAATTAPDGTVFDPGFNTNNADYCRSGQDISMNAKPGVIQSITHITTVTYFATTMGQLCWGGPWLCPGAHLTFQNNIIFGIEDALPPLHQDYGGNNNGVGGFCWGANCYAQQSVFPTVTFGYNLWHGVRTVNCPSTGYAGDKCADALFIGETPAWICLVSGGSGCTFTEATLETTIPFTKSASWLLSSSSPAIQAGASRREALARNIPSLRTQDYLTTDYFHTPWGAPSSLGAAEYGTPVPAPFSPTLQGVTLQGVKVNQ